MFPRLHLPGTTTSLTSFLNLLKDSQPKTQPKPTSYSVTTIPTSVQFQVNGITNRNGTNDIRLQFHRDEVYGLGLEFSQEVVPASNGKLPRPGYRDHKQKTFLGLHDARQFTWQLPEDFGTDEIQKVVTQFNVNQR